MLRSLVGQGVDVENMIGASGFGRSFWSELLGRVARIPRVGSRLVIQLHRAGLGASVTTWADLAELAEREAPAELSVDVFDTCLVRDLLGDRPIEAAIERARNESGPATGRMRAAELEGLICRPVPGVSTALHRIRRAGVAVTFLSDTERSSATVRQLLAAADIFVDGDQLRVSCEEAATKSSGELFAKVWPKPASRRSPVWHVGNNWWSDVTMAQSAGLRAFAIMAAEPTRYESVMAGRPETAGPAVAAAARKARLAIVAEAAGDDVACSVQLEVLGAQVAGQAFAAFLLWLADQSEVEGIEHLWFLSRDGELLLEMAEAMPSDHWKGRSLDYLHCSRWSWLLAGAASHGFSNWLEAGTRDSRAFIHANRHRVPLASLLGRIGLNGDDLGDHPSLADLPLDMPLPIDMVGHWNDLLDDVAIRSVLLARSVERRSLIVDYLRTLGMPKSPIALVDVGWRGRLAWVMSPILAEVTGYEPIHFHIGGDNVLADVDAAVDIRRFAFDGQRPPWPITNPVSCVETITSSGRPRIVGYRRTGPGTAEPVLQRGIDQIDTPDRRRLWEGATRTASELPSRATLEELGCTTDSLGSVAREVLALWWTEPIRLEVQAMSGLAFEADDDGQSIVSLVTPYTPRELSKNERASRQWREGSEVLSTRHYGILARIYRFVRCRTWRLDSH